MTAYPIDDALGEEESVVLLDESGSAIGSAPKGTVHTTRTPLHLAFSCYVFDADDNLLVTQRGLQKATWPGVWTNSVCGHPAPGEGLLEAVHRRSAQELGLSVHDVKAVLPAFRYRAVMASGIVENEMCPVLVARTEDAPDIDPTEVAASAWVGWERFRDNVNARRWEVSPWCRDQVRELTRLGRLPGDWPAGARSELPAALLQR